MLEDGVKARALMELVLQRIRTCCPLVGGRRSLNLLAPVHQRDAHVEVAVEMLGYQVNCPLQGLVDIRLAGELSS